MIRIREKDILFIAINLVMFLGWSAYFWGTTAYGIMIMGTPAEPTVQEGLAYISFICARGSIIIAGMLTLFVDFWWLYREVRRYRKGYWKENL